MDQIPFSEADKQHSDHRPGNEATNNPVPLNTDVLSGATTSEEVMSDQIARPPSAASSDAAPRIGTYGDAASNTDPINGGERDQN